MTTASSLPSGSPPGAVELLRCNASTAWAQAVADRYRTQWPHPDPIGAAETVWWSLGPNDWRAALAAHPRIGDRPPPGSRESAEQSGADGAAEAVLAEIAAANLEYEKRFAMTYVVRATGRSATEMLALLRERLGNDPDRELRIAAGQQWEITRLRLADLLGLS